jgi:hypothetical protein
MNRNQREEETAARQPNFDTLVLFPALQPKKSQGMSLFFSFASHSSLFVKKQGEEVLRKIEARPSARGSKTLLACSLNLCPTTHPNVLLACVCV